MSHLDRLHRDMTGARAAGQHELADELAARIEWCRTGRGPHPMTRRPPPAAEDLVYVPVETEALPC